MTIYELIGYPGLMLVMVVNNDCLAKSVTRCAKPSKAFISVHSKIDCTKLNLVSLTSLIGGNTYKKGVEFTFMEPWFGSTTDEAKTGYWEDYSKLENYCNPQMISDSFPFIFSPGPNFSIQLVPFELLQDLGQWRPFDSGGRPKPCVQLECLRPVRESGTGRKIRSYSVSSNDDGF